MNEMEYLIVLLDRALARKEDGIKDFMRAVWFILEAKLQEGRGVSFQTTQAQFERFMGKLNEAEPLFAEIGAQHIFERIHTCFKFRNGVVQ